MARTDAADERAAPFVPWSQFLPYFVRNVGQGEHVSVIGQTGSGKSVLIRELLTARTNASEHWRSVVLANKVRDETLTSWAREPGWRKVRKWSDVREHERRVILWPSIASDEEWANVAHEFDSTLRALWSRGRHAVYCDEIRTLSQVMGLKRMVELWYLLGRSNGCGLWAGTQRAAFVPLEFYSQARWLFMFTERSPAARKALMNHCGGADGAQVARIASRLSRREFLCVDTWDGWVCRSRVELHAGTAPERNPSP